jgi:NAD(P)-dependent dehydrogenase (short-subunit alcohol dehydrogenase family)
MINIASKRALLTGGSRRITDAVAIALTKDGVDVALTFQKLAKSSDSFKRAVAAAVRFRPTALIVARLRTSQPPPPTSQVPQPPDHRNHRER